MCFKPFASVFCLIFFLSSCEKETSLVFRESEITAEGNLLVEINIPLAQGDSNLAASVNHEIENLIIASLAIGDIEEPLKDVKKSIRAFNNEYNRFSKDFPEDHLPWEAQIDGEIVYQSPNIISIAITSYINTGGAHGNLNITFKNFDTSTGQVVPNSSLFESIDEFKKTSQPYYHKAIEAKDVFAEAEVFELPANIGYSDEGIILLYNTYEIAPYSTGIIEFTIPYNEVNDFLVIEGS